MISVITISIFQNATTGIPNSLLCWTCTAHHKITSHGDISGTKIVIIDPEKTSLNKSKKCPKPYKCLNSQIPKSRRLEVGAQRYGNRYHMISHDNRQVALGGHCLCLAASQQHLCNFVALPEQKFWQAPQLRNFASSWLRLSRIIDYPVRNFETSHLRDFGFPELLTTLSATSKHRSFVTSAL